MNTNNQMSRLLLVDDDPEMTRLLQRIIANHFQDQLTIESLTDPEAALAMVREEVVDILLTDLEMPGINGLEILKAAKERNPITQVLLLTGHSNHEALLSALELGAADYLLKPADKSELFKVVDQANERRQRWRQALGATWRQTRQ